MLKIFSIIEEEFMSEKKDLKKERQEHILQKAVELFALKGYEGLKTVDFAKASNMSLGLMYHYFKDKKTLYNQVILYCLYEFNNYLEDIFKDSDTFFTNLAHFAVNDFKKEPLYAHMYIVLADADINSAEILDETREKIKKINEKTLVNTIRIIEYNQEKGVFRPANPFALARIFWGMIESVMKMITRGYERDLPEPEWLICILTGK